MQVVLLCCKEPCTCPYSGSQVVLPVPAPVSSRPPGDEARHRPEMLQTKPMTV